MRIDVHAHHYTPEFIDHFVSLGANRPAPSPPATLEQRLELMDQAGIDVQVLCTGAVQPYIADPSKAVQAARFANDAYKDLVERHAGRFAAFGCLPLPHIDAAITEAGRCLDELGYPGLNLGCSIAGRPLDEPQFAPLWEELNRRKAVVFAHPQGIGGPMMDSFGLNWMVGPCVEDTVTAVRLALSGLIDRYPDVKVIVPHLGGTLPFLWQRLEDAAERERERSPGMSQIRPTTVLKRLYYDTVNQTPAALRCACEILGADRIMLGTDYPYLSGAKFTGCVTYIQESGLTASEAEAILDKNAQALLELPSKP